MRQCMESSQRRTLHIRTYIYKYICTYTLHIHISNAEYITLHISNANSLHYHHYYFCNFMSKQLSAEPLTHACVRVRAHT